MGPKTAPVTPERGVGPSGQTASHYIWQPPQRQISVAIGLDVINRMRRWLNEAASANVEEGGLLLGSAEEEEGTAARTIIEDFEPLDIAHDRGLRFTLTQKDKARLQKRIETWRKQAGRTVVGVVRSHLRRGLYLDVADFGLFKEYFQAPLSVFLLVRPGTDATAGFFFWEGEDVRLHAPYLEFPFDARALGALPVDAAVTAKQAPVPARRETETQSRARHLDSVRVVRYAWAAAGLATAVLAAGVWWRGVPRHSASNLGLNVAYDSSNAVRLTWNPRAPAVAAATRGTLRIEDGPIHISVDLNRQQLMLGGELYKPSSNNVNFMLEVSGRAGRSNESIRSVIRTSEPAPVVARTAPSTEGTAERMRSPVIAARVLTPPPAPVIAPVSPRVKARAPQVKPRTIHARKRRPKRFVPPAIEPRVVTAPPAAIALVQTQTVPILATRRVSPLWDLPRLSPPDAGFTATVTPEPEPKMVRVFGPFRPRAGKDFAPAKPLVEVKPDVPPTIAESLHGELKLTFRIWVDKTGRVDDVECLSTGADHRFVGLADVALRHWKFEPARFKDRPEASRLLITVRFRNPFLRASAAPQSRE